MEAAENCFRDLWHLRADLLPQRSYCSPTLRPRGNDFIPVLYSDILLQIALQTHQTEEQIIRFRHWEPASGRPGIALAPSSIQMASPAKASLSPKMGQRLWWDLLSASSPHLRDCCIVKAGHYTAKFILAITGESNQSKCNSSGGIRVGLDIYMNKNSFCALTCCDKNNKNFGFHAPGQKPDLWTRCYKEIFSPNSSPQSYRQQHRV